MRRLRPGLAVILAFVGLALLGGAAPSWAHTGLDTELSATPAQGADSSPATAEASKSPTLSAAPKAPGVPWLVLLGAFVAVGLGGRRPRRALIVAVVLLLVVFAFEDALHSVHHLVDKSQLNKCAVAVAAAHLNAIAADDGGVPDVILPAVAVTAEAAQADPVARFPSPVQGRAPPTQAG